MSDFHIKQGDTSPAVAATLTDADLEPIPLTNAASVKFHMIDPKSDTAKVDAAAAFVVKADGTVEYLWQAGDTDTAGKFNGEFQVTWNDGTITSFPNNGYIRIEITKEIA